MQPRGPEKFQWPRSNSSNTENYVNRGMTIIASPLLGFAGEPVMANQGVTIRSIEGNAGETVHDHRLRSTYRIPGVAGENTPSALGCFEVGNCEFWNNSTFRTEFHLIL